MVNDVFKNSSVFYDKLNVNKSNDIELNKQIPSVRYFTFQGNYTLDCLRDSGCFSSTIDNDTYREGLFKDILGKDGLVYYSVYKDLKFLKDIYNPNLGEHLIELDVSKLPNERIEMAVKDFDKIEYELIKGYNDLSSLLGRQPTDNELFEYAYDTLGYDKEFCLKPNDFDGSNKKFGVMSCLKKDMIKKVYKDFAYK